MNINVYLDYDCIYNVRKKAFNEEYINICEELIKIARVTIVYTKSCDDLLPLNFLKKRYETIETIACDSLEQIGSAVRENEIVLIISEKYTDIKKEKNTLRLCVCFDHIKNKYPTDSYVALAKKKLLYTQLSSSYSFLIDKDTDKEFSFIKTVLQNNGIDSGDILDCCCGVGRHDVLLAEHGYDVFGVDLSEQQIDTANKINLNKNTRYVVGDIRDYKYPYRRFDAAICMWTSFNYLNTKELACFINNVYEGLKTDGILVLETKNFSLPLEYKVYLKELEDDTKNIYILVIKRIKDNIQTSKYIYFISDKETKKFDAFVDDEIVNVYSKKTILRIAYKKFSLINAFGDYEMNDYNANASERMCLVLKKMDQDGLK